MKLTTTINILIYLSILGALFTCYMFLEPAFFEVKDLVQQSEYINELNEIAQNRNNLEKVQIELDSQRNAENAVLTPLDPNEYPTFEQRDYIMEQIMAVADEMDFRDVSTLMDLAFCESSFRTRVVGLDGELGLFQFHPKWYPIGEQCGFSVQCSTKKAIEVIREKGIYEWTCGRIIADWI